jgi:ACS family tartrate transporter-like MFS transporter
LGGLASSPAAGFVGLLVGAFGVGASMSLFWTVPIEMLGGTGVAGALAVINVIGNSSGIVAHGLIGWVRDHTGGFGATLLALAAVLIFATLIVNAFAKRHTYSREVATPQV